MEDWVLSDDELKFLLSVGTSKAEAKTIRERFIQIERCLKRREPRIILIGCPHCTLGNAALCCAQCRYTKALCILKRRFPQFCPCLSVKFGGMSLVQVNRKFDKRGLGIVTLGVGQAAVSAAATRASQAVIDAAVRWARGHINWADAVLNGGKKP